MRKQILQLAVRRIEVLDKHVQRSRNGVTAHQILQLAVRFIANQDKHVSEHREVTVYQKHQLAAGSIEVLDNTCLNRKRGQNKPESIICDPMHTIPLGCGIHQSSTFAGDLTILTPSEVSRPAVAQQISVYHDTGHHMTQQVELANKRCPLQQIVVYQNRKR